MNEIQAIERNMKLGLTVRATYIHEGVWYRRMASDSGLEEFYACGDPTRQLDRRRPVLCTPPDHVVRALRAASS